MTADEHNTEAEAAAETPEVQESQAAEPAEAAPVDAAETEAQAPVEAAEAEVLDAEAAAADDVEQDLEALQDPLVEAAAMRDLAQRTQADFENFRKRARQNEAMAAERGAARLAGELVAALDNFELALAASAAASDSDPSAEATVRGFSLIRDELLAGLGRAGVEIDRPTEGEKFDPQVHEAIAHVPAEGAEAGSIVAVHQAGYRLGSTVIRPARVAVAGG